MSKTRKPTYEKSFASHPKSEFWSDENEFSPEEVFKSSHKKYKFDCNKCNHSFESSLNSIARGNRFCPYCGHKNLCKNLQCSFCFENSFASHPKSKFWSSENEILPRNVFKFTPEKYKFDCNVCHHTFEAPLRGVSNNTFCSYCANKILCDVECELCEEKSFASHPKSKFWSSKNITTPRKVFKSSNEKFEFECNECNHNFMTTLHDVSSGKFCPYCGGQSLCDAKCNFCYEKSFASHPKSKFWSGENNISPREVFKSTTKKYIFFCDECDHNFLKSLSNIKNESFCPFCLGQLLCGQKNCKSCKEKSFASHPKAQFWSNQNKVSPFEIFKFCRKNFKFDCPYCDNIYEASLNNITSNNIWCTCITNKTENKLYNYLKRFFVVEKQKKFNWCKMKRELPFDFFIEEYKLLIELDGVQHFKQVSTWKSPEETQKIDIYKMKLAQKQGYSMIRIFQEDVWNDKNNWENKLMDVIEKCTEPTNILIGKIYSSHPAYDMERTIFMT